MARQTPTHRLERIRRRHEARPSPHLDLSGLELTRIPPWVFHSDLMTLSLHHNRLTELPPELGLFVFLEQLDVRFNALTALPDCLEGLACLQQVWAEGNPLELPPYLDHLGRRTRDR